MCAAPRPWRSLPPRALPLIERLAKARLLTILEERGVRTVEVAHEALLRKWPLLRGWLDEEREFLVGKSQLERRPARLAKRHSGTKTGNSADWPEADARPPVAAD